MRCAFVRLFASSLGRRGTAQMHAGGLVSSTAAPTRTACMPPRSLLSSAWCPTGSAPAPRCPPAASGLLWRHGSPAGASLRHSPARHGLHVCAAAATEAKEETFTYQAEVDRLMDLIVNSLYSNRDVFLRELISNASDALDKLRLQGLTDASVSAGPESLEIRVRADPAAKTITIEDSGVGMSREEVLSSLGTIARSGTAKFAEMIKENQGDASLIGQFGVGFYSAFLVADRVAVLTRSAADPAAPASLWQSRVGSSEFTITEVPDADLGRGTRITLHLKPEAAEFADDAKLSALIKQYSEFISFPIRLWQTKTETVDVVDAEKTAERQKVVDDAAKAEGKDAGEPVEDVMKQETRSRQEWAVQNDQQPLWTRSPRDVSAEEYNTLYKAMFKEFLEPLAHSHFSVEGTIEFSALLFVPGMAPFEQMDWMAKSRNMRLYVKRVFISDEFNEDLLPRYLTFVKGLVDSSDLPLNVSREILQESRVVRTIRKQLTKRSLDMIRDIAARPAKEAEASSPGGLPPRTDYETFWESFGKFIKLGAIEEKDPAAKASLSELLRFSSSKSGEGLTSLAQYVERLRPGQTDIYYIAADSLAAAQTAPFVEKLIEKDLEVLYLTEPIDEPAVSSTGEYQGKKFVDVTREGLDLGDGEDAKAKSEEVANALRPLTDFLKKQLGSRIEKVAISTRLADSPCALVTSKFGWSAYQERIMKSQSLGDARASEYMKGRKTLEINPDHPVIQALRGELEAGEQGAAQMAELLYDTALVTSGFSIDSPKDFARRIYSMIGLAAGNAGGSASTSLRSSGSAQSNGSREEVTPDGVRGP